MDRNVGPEDRVVRLVVGIALAIVLYMQVLTGTAAIIAGAVAAYLPSRRATRIEPWSVLRSE